ITKEISLENLKNIKLLGSQQPEPHYRKAKLLLMTSEKEGFPNVILEAQSYGVIPFLFNSYMAVQDIIKNGENGFHYPAFDINKMVDGIEKIAKNDNLRKCISIKCLDSAQDFTLDNVGRKWVNFFNQIA
ncbi:MAG: glycosyltransferase, partial [Flavobacteriales bacterium]|nr:glycosyltransferase [Flavobacteriales bacterium]